MLTQGLTVPACPQGSAVSEPSYTVPVVLLSVYFFVEYPKPAFLDPLRPALVLQSIFVLFLVTKCGIVLEVLKEKYFVFYLLLLLEMAIHVPIARNNYWAFYSLVPMITYLIFSLSFCVFVDNLEKLKALISALIVNLILCAIDELATQGKYFGARGYVGDTNDLALMMNVMMPVAFYMGLSHRGIKRGLYWLAVIIFVAANVSSLSRGGFVGMVAVALLCWLNSRHKIRSLIGVLLIVIAFSRFVPEGYKAEMLTIQEEGMETGTGRDRVEFWKVARRIFLDNPFIGVGQGNISWVLGEYQDWDYFQRGIGGRAVHSIYFTILPELGILGVSLTVLMLSNLLSKSREMSKAVRTQAGVRAESDRMSLEYIMLGLTTGLAGYLVSGIFLSAFYYPAFWNVSGIMIATYRIFRNSRSDEASVMLGSAFTENAVPKNPHQRVPATQWALTQK